MKTTITAVPARKAISIIVALALGAAFALLFSAPAFAAQADQASPTALKTAATSNEYGSFSVSPNNKKANYITVKASVNSNDALMGISVDGTAVWLNKNADTSIRTIKKAVNLNQKKYATGDHTIQVISVQSYARYNAGYGGIAAYSITVPKLPKPNYKGVFEVYSKYLNYSPYDFGKNLESYPLYLEYSSNGGKTWKRSGSMKWNSIKLYSQQSFKIGGFAANKKYKTRIRYGTTVDGKIYLGPVLNTGVIKTGKAKKPPIKSVKVQAVNVKYHEVRHPGYWNVVGGVAFWHNAWTEKYWTYKIKVTVNLKAKPGTTGLYINGAFVKGNKKTYSKVFSVYPNYAAKKPPAGLKYKVGIASYQGKSYGGYSPAYVKTKKVTK